MFLGRSWAFGVVACSKQHIPGAELGKAQEGMVIPLLVLSGSVCWFREETSGLVACVGAGYKLNGAQSIPGKNPSTAAVCYCSLLHGFHPQYTNICQSTLPKLLALDI